MCNQAEDMIEIGIQCELGVECLKLLGKNEMPDSNTKLCLKKFGFPVSTRSIGNDGVLSRVRHQLFDYSFLLCLEYIDLFRRLIGIKKVTQVQKIEETL